MLQSMVFCFETLNSCFAMFCTNFKHNPLAEFALHSQCIDPICSFVLRCFGEHQLFNGPGQRCTSRGVRSSRQADPDALCSPSSGASKPEDALLGKSHLITRLESLLFVYSQMPNQRLADSSVWALLCRLQRLPAASRMCKNTPVSRSSQFCHPWWRPVGQKSPKELRIGVRTGGISLESTSYVWYCLIILYIHYINDCVLSCWSFICCFKNGTVHEWSAHFSKAFSNLLGLTLWLLVQPLWGRSWEVSSELDHTSTSWRKIWNVLFQGECRSAQPWWQEGVSIYICCDAMWESKGGISTLPTFTHQDYRYKYGQLN